MTTSQILKFGIGIQWRCVCLPAIITLVVGCGMADAQEPPAQIKPRIQNGWTELPRWAESGLPFDARSYYAIDESDNREPLYLEAFLEFDYSDGTSFFSGIENAAEHATKRKADKSRRERIVEFLDRNVDELGYMRIGPQNHQEAKEILRLALDYSRQTELITMQQTTRDVNFARRTRRRTSVESQLTT